MSERQDFKWRPNDESIQTKLRYELEAKHWKSALNKASATSTASFGEALGLLGLLISFIITTVLFCIVCLIDFSVFIRKQFK